MWFSLSTPFPIQLQKAFKLDCDIDSFSRRLSNSTPFSNSFSENFQTLLFFLFIFHLAFKLDSVLDSFFRMFSNSTLITFLSKFTYFDSRALVFIKNILVALKIVILSFINFNLFFCIILLLYFTCLLYVSSFLIFSLAEIFFVQ